MSIIAIDCGASFIKASKIEGDNIVKSVVEKTPSDNNSFKLELSVEIIKKILEELSDDDETYLGFSNEMHGFVLTDIYGKPITKYFSWQNECAYELYDGEITYLEELNSLLDEEEVLKTGMPLKAGLPNVNLFYVVNNNVLKENETYFFYTLGDYYIRVLSGMEPYMHETNAAGTGLFDVTKHCWNENIIAKICGNSKSNIIFPQVYRGQNVLKCSINGKKTWLFPALGDQQAALLGAGACKEGDVSFNFGTGAQISVLTGKTDFSKDYQIRPFFNGYYLKTIPHIPSGRALNVYFNFINEFVLKFANVTDDEVWEEINNESEMNKVTMLEVDMSFFTNAVTSNTVGSIGNICEGNFTVGNLFYSVYSQMAKNIEDICLKLNISNFGRLIISGGILIKNVFLRKMILDKFKGNYEIVLAENETAKGIAYFVKECMDEGKSI